MCLQSVHCQLTQQRTAWAIVSCENFFTLLQNTYLSHLFSLHHLLVEVVGEHALRVEFSGALSTHEHTVLTHQTSSADGYQRNAMAARTLIQVKVSALHLSAHRDCPADRKAISLLICARTMFVCCNYCVNCIPGCIWVPDNNISISPRNDTTFAWIQVVDFCRVGACHCHKTILVHFSCNLRILIHQNITETTTLAVFCDSSSLSLNF